MSWTLDWHGVWSRFGYEVVDIEIGDIDSDGDQDMAITVIIRSANGEPPEGRILWLENIKAVLWHKHIVATDLELDGSFLIRHTDFDHDGDTDLLVYTQADESGVTQHAVRGPRDQSPIAPRCLLTHPALAAY